MATTATTDTTGWSQASLDAFKSAQSLATQGSFSAVGNTTTYTAPAGQQAITVAPTTPTAPATISSSNLATTPTTNFVQPTTTQPYPVASLQVPDLSKLTPTQQSAQDLSTQLEGLYTQDAGRAAYQTQQEGIAGVPEAQKSITDLSTQLTGLKNEAAAIPLQLQQGAADRGVTTPVLGAQENSRLRTNAIASLGVSTLLEASQGNLTNAQRIADNAVKEKYDPIEALIKAKLTNYQLIMSSPQYSADEKQQAFQMQQYLKQEELQVAQQKTDYTNVLKLSTDAASNIANFQPTAQYPTAASALQAMSQATDPQAALQIAASVGLTTGTTAANGTKILGSASTGYFSYDPATGKTTPISASTATGGTYQAGMLTTLLQSQGKTADDATLKSLWSQYGNGGTYTNDTAHNSVLYKALGGTTPTTSTSSASGTTSTSGYKFTTSQINTGAAKAALGITAFKALAGDVQNFYIHATPANLTDLQGALTQVKSGSVTVAEANSAVDALNVSAAVKTYFKSLIATAGTSAPKSSTSTSTTSSTSFLGNVWNSISSFFGF